MTSETTASDRNRKVLKAALLSIGVNLLLVAIKYFLASISGSIALVADAWHSLSDVAVSLLVLAGVWISKKGWRSAAVIENIIALLISLLIFLAAYALIHQSFRVQPEEGIRYLPVALIGAVICAALSKWIGQYKVRIGSAEDSLSLRADGNHSIMDFYTTTVVVVGLLGQMIGLRIDGFAALVIALFVMEVGLEIAFAAIKSLIRRQEFSQASFNLLGGKRVVWLGNFLRDVLRRRGWVDERPLTVIFFAWLGARKKRLLTHGSLFLLAGYGLSGFFTVAPHQSAVVTIFGKALPKPAAPGLHYAPPRPLGKVYKIDTSLDQWIEVGFRSRRSETKTVYAGRSSYEWQSYHKAGTYEKKTAEAIMLTGDENLLDVNVVIHFNVADPYAFTFGFTDREALLRFSTETVLRAIVSVTPIDSILAGSRHDLEALTFKRLQAMLDGLGSGVRIVAVQLQDVHPPVEVVDAFRDVASAKENMALIVNQAYAERNQNVPMARAEAAASITAAEAYRDAKAAHATGDAEHFSALFAGAAGDRQLARFRFYVDRLEKSLAGKRKFIVSPTLEPGALDLRVFTNKQVKSDGKKPADNVAGGVTQ